MAGHNKWSQIKRKKAVIDAKKGKEFTRIIREITIAARAGGGDPAGNPRLRLLLEKAKEVNMPLENAQKAIKRGTGELPGVHYEEHRYEGYGPHGIAVIVDTLTNNKNRTVADLRRFFSSKGGSLGESGSVGWMFATKGVVRISGKKTTEDELLELLLDYAIEDIEQDEELSTILCDPTDLHEVKRVLKEHEFTIESADIEWIATSPTTLTEEQADKAIEFLDNLEDLDDVKHVFSNFTT